MGSVETVAAAHEGPGADRFQRPLRSRFRHQLKAGIKRLRGEHAFFLSITTEAWSDEIIIRLVDAAVSL
jgi:hypothetical protein